MLTGLLGLIVVFFATKSLAGLAGRAVLKLLGHGAVGVARVGARAGERIGDGIGSRIAKQSKQSRNTPTAMTGFAGTIEDFGMVVFGSEAKLVAVASAKLVEALHEKLDTDKGRSEVAKRLAKISQENV